MKTPEIKEGVAVRYPGTGALLGHDRAHTHVVVTDPDQDGSVLLVSICSFHRFADQTCVIVPDGTWEPDRQKELCCILPHNARVGSQCHGTYSQTGNHLSWPGAAAIFERIKAGVAISNETPEVFRTVFLRSQPQRQAGRVLRSNREND